MFENRHEPIAPRIVFIFRLIKSFAWGFFLIAIVLAVGVIGYHELENLSWIDAFLNASMILSSMGPAQPLATTSGKLFASFYALFSGLIFISVVTIVIAPIAHRFLHTFHHARAHKKKSHH